MGLFNRKKMTAEEEEEEKKRKLARAAEALMQDREDREIMAANNIRREQGERVRPHYTRQMRSDDLSSDEALIRHAVEKERWEGRSFGSLVAMAINAVKKDDWRAEAEDLYGGLAEKSRNMGWDRDSRADANARGKQYRSDATDKSVEVQRRIDDKIVEVQRRKGDKIVAEEAEKRARRKEIQRRTDDKIVAEAAEWRQRTRPEFELNRAGERAQVNPLYESPLARAQRQMAEEIKASEQKQVREQQQQQQQLASPVDSYPFYNEQAQSYPLYNEPGKSPVYNEPGQSPAKPPASPLSQALDERWVPPLSGVQTVTRDNLASQAVELRALIQEGETKKAESAWNPLYDAMRGALGSIPFVGPVTDSGFNWVEGFTMPDAERGADGQFPDTPVPWTERGVSWHLQDFLESSPPRSKSDMDFRNRAGLLTENIFKSLTTGTGAQTDEDRARMQPYNVFAPGNNQVKGVAAMKALLADIERRLGTLQ